MNSPVSFPALSLHARSLNIPDSANPNKLPFSGVLTKIDVPSDSPPEGSNGRRILVTRAAAEKAIDSLLGMAVNYNPEGHSPQEKIGFISSAEIQGSEINIGGFIYAADFPDTTAAIRANKDKLGFSFEARDLFTPDPNADPVHISDLQFTGAAILLKNAAAYKTTSIFASENKDIKPMSFINRMSAAERTKLADQISSANEHLTIDERRDLVDALTVALAGDLKAKAAADKKHEILSRIYAAEGDVKHGGKEEIQSANNLLRNAGVPRSLEYFTNVRRLPGA